MILEFKEPIEFSKNYTNDKSDKYDSFRAATEGIEVYATEINRFQPSASFICMLDIELAYKEY